MAAVVGSSNIGPDGMSSQPQTGRGSTLGEQPGRKKKGGGEKQNQSWDSFLAFGQHIHFLLCSRSCVGYLGLWVSFKPHAGFGGQLDPRLLQILLCALGDIVAVLVLMSLR